MAIQNRRGIHTDFDATKMVAGEFAVVQSGDPNNTNGTSVYICFQNGSAKRLTLIEDLDAVVGSLGDLETTDKTSIVDAINELAEKSSILFGTSSTGGSTRDKVVTCADFEAVDGALIAITLSQTNTVTDARFNVNGTGAKSIYSNHEASSDTSWLTKGTYLFVYSSTNGGRFTLIGATERIASDTAPAMDGTAAVGTSKKYARADHVHPSDTTRATVAALNETNAQVTQLKEDLTDEITARESADEAINAELATKADADTPIATAEQLMSDSFTVDQVPYLFRPSGGSGADREIDQIVGGSIVWNQLCNSSSVTVLNGHKYYMVKGGTASIGASAGSAIIGLTSGTDMVSDLTQMFGSAIADYIYNLEQTTAGAGVAWFKKFFPKDYYAYDAGAMMHVSDLQSHDISGKNLLRTVTPTYGGLNITKNSDGSYSIKGTTSKNGSIYFWNNANDPIVVNEDSIFTSGWNPSSQATYAFGTKDSTTAVEEARSATINIPKGEYTSFRIYVAGSRTYDFVLKPMIRFASVSDATYEPYTKHSYSLDSTLTLRGIPKLDSNNQLYYDGDTYAADGTVTRKYGVVDLGTLNWEIQTTNVFRAVVNGKKNAVSSTAIDSILCTKYACDTGDYVVGGVVDKAVGSSISNSRIFIRDTAYTDAASFKTAMSGVYLVYELATPTTETATPFTNPQVCDPYGTEEYVTTSLVPVGHYTKYPANLRSAIERVMEQVPEAPSANGTYVLKATKTSNGVTYAWIAE